MNSNANSKRPLMSGTRSRVFNDTRGARALQGRQQNFFQDGPSRGSAYGINGIRAILRHAQL